MFLFVGKEQLAARSACNRNRMPSMTLRSQDGTLPKRAPVKQAPAKRAPVKQSKRRKRGMTFREIKENDRKFHREIEEREASQVKGEDVDLAPIAAKYGIRLEYMSEEECQAYYCFNHSASADRDEIMLGIYEDKELQSLSFFHELGHCLESDYRGLRTLLGIEANAWATAWRISREDYNIAWTDKAIVWAMGQLMTYYKPEITVD
jgi:hypothetical protein